MGFALRADTRVEAAAQRQQMVVDRNPGLADAPQALSRMLRPRDRMLWVLLANI
jgi:hypothetical protein